MSCELVNKIGTGDCEHDANYKSEPNLASMVATELVTEILEDALDIVEEIEEEATGEKVEGQSMKGLGGLGDQLEPDEGLGEEPPVKHHAVEKKSRLTDLVKNSKHMLARLIQNESGKDAGPERVLRIVELDSGDQPYAIQRKEEDLGLSLDKGTQKGDDDGRSRTFPIMAGGSGKHVGLAARYRTMKFPAELKTKKWNFGTKIVNYIRKHQAKKEGREKEKRASDGVELKPKDGDF